MKMELGDGVYIYIFIIFYPLLIVTKAGFAITR